MRFTGWEICCLPSPVTASAGLLTTPWDIIFPTASLLLATPPPMGSFLRDACSMQAIPGCGE